VRDVVGTESRTLTGGEPAPLGPAEIDPRPRRELTPKEAASLARYPTPPSTFTLAAEKGRYRPRPLTGLRPTCVLDPRGETSYLLAFATPEALRSLLERTLGPLGFTLEDRWFDAATVRNDPDGDLVEFGRTVVADRDVRLDRAALRHRARRRWLGVGIGLGLVAATVLLFAWVVGFPFPSSDFPLTLLGVGGLALAIYSAAALTNGVYSSDAVVLRYAWRARRGKRAGPSHPSDPRYAVTVWVGRASSEDWSSGGRGGSGRAILAGVASDELASVAQALQDALLGPGRAPRTGENP